MKIAILGGGIGGLSSAIALKQKGFDVEVYERHSSVSDIGAGIVCWPNATFVLGKLGVLDEVKQVSGAVMSMNRFSDAGENLGSLSIANLSSIMGYPSLSIIRKDLMTILSRRLSELQIQVNYGSNIQAIKSNESGLANVFFENGTSIQSDIVIGADGRMNSIARKYVNNDNSPIYQGFVNWVGVYESDKNLFADISVSDYWGVGERFGIVPVSSKKVYWAGAVTAKELQINDPASYLSELKTLFHSWPDPIMQIINDTPVARINKINIHDHDPIQCWHKDNVLLIGDAAHSPLPTSGQGACQALEDAWHLAELMNLNSANIDQVFVEFTKIRLAKTTGITLGGRNLAQSIFNQDPEFCKQRNLQSRNTDYHKAVSVMAQGWAQGLPITNQSD